MCGKKLGIYSVGNGQTLKEWLVKEIHDQISISERLLQKCGRSRSEGKMDLGRPNSFPSKWMRAIEIKTGEMKNLSWGNSVRDKKGRV